MRKLTVFGTVTAAWLGISVLLAAAHGWHTTTMGTGSYVLYWAGYCLGCALVIAIGGAFLTGLFYAVRGIYRGFKRAMSR